MGWMSLSTWLLVNSPLKRPILSWHTSPFLSFNKPSFSTYSIRIFPWKHLSLSCKLSPEETIFYNTSTQIQLTLSSYLPAFLTNLSNYANWACTKYSSNEKTELMSLVNLSVLKTHLTISLPTRKSKLKIQEFLFFAFFLVQMDWPGYLKLWKDTPVKKNNVLVQHKTAASNISSECIAL